VVALTPAGAVAGDADYQRQQQADDCQKHEDASPQGILGAGFVGQIGVVDKLPADEDVEGEENESPQDENYGGAPGE